MSTVANLYPLAASWTFQNASLAGNVLTVGAGGDAHFSITPGADVQAARTYNIKLTSNAYTNPYAPTSFMYMKIKYSATEYVDVKAPIVNMGAGYETTVELSQAVFETFIIGFSSTTGMTLTLITLADPDDDASKATKEDLDGYVTTISANATIDTYINSAEGKASIIIATSATYQKISDMTGYLLQSDVATEIGSYVDSQAGTAKIILAVSGTYQTQESMDDYLLTSSFDASIGAYVDSVAGKAKVVSAVSATYQTIASMSSYPTNTSLSNTLANYPTETELNSALASYVLNNTLDASIGAYVDSVTGKAKVVSAVSATYQTIASMSSYPTNTSLSNTLANYPTETELNSALASYVLNNTLDASIGAYVDSVAGKAKVVSAVSATYQTIASMSSYPTNTSLSNTLANYPTETELNSALASYVLNNTLDASIGAYVDSVTGKAKVVSAVSATYQTIASMSSYPTNTSLSNTLASYVVTTTLNASIGAYIDSSTGTAKVVTAASGTYETKTNVATISSTVNNQGASIALVVGSTKLVSTGGTVNASLVVSTINGGSFDINAARINFTGFTTFLRSSDLGSSGTTSIDGARITTGVIDAARINTTDIILKKVYNASGATAVDCTNSSYLCIGGTYGSSAGFETIRLFASGSLIIGTYTYTSRALTIDTVSTVIYSSYAYWKLGSSTYPFEEVRTNKLWLNGTQMELYNEFVVKKIYAAGSSTYCVSLDSSYDLVPYNSTSFSLGSTSYWWADAYIKTATFGNSTTDGIIVNTAGELRPNTASSSYPQYLGSSTYPWHYAYIGSLSCKIGTSGSSTLGFFGYTPTTRKTIADVSTSATSSTIASKVNEIITALQAYGLIA